MRPLHASYLFFMCLACGVLLPVAGHAQSESTVDDIAVATRFTYHAGSSDRPDTARALALFGAKQAAVRQAAERLASEGLLPPYGSQRMAVYCLVADQMAPPTMAASVTADGGMVTAGIRSALSLADFVRADIRNTRLDREERHFDLKDEMEPAVKPDLQPALELSRAYRYLGREDWRKTIIYLDHLQTKYAHWDVLYMVKAAAFQGMHETRLAREAWLAACRLGNHAACSSAGEPPPAE